MENARDLFRAFSIGTRLSFILDGTIAFDGKFSSSFLLTRYLPLYSSGCLPTLLK